MIYLKTQMGFKTFIKWKKYFYSIWIFIKNKIKNSCRNKNGLHKTVQATINAQ